jgi:hypothetical protein
MLPRHPPTPLHLLHLAQPRADHPTAPRCQAPHFKKGSATAEPPHPSPPLFRSATARAPSPLPPPTSCPARWSRSRRRAEVEAAATKTYLSLVSCFSVGYGSDSPCTSPPPPFLGAVGPCPVDDGHRRSAPVMEHHRPSKLRGPH